MLRALVPNVTALAEKLVANPKAVKSTVRQAMADPDSSALEKLYRDAWKAGTKAATAVLPSSKADAATSTPSALAELLRLAGEIWQAIAGWTSDRIATVVTEALSSDGHADVRSIAKQIQGIVDDPDRAHMIAQTECTRAMTGAALATYKAANIDQIEFLTADDDNVDGGDPDGPCAENEDQGPIPIGAQFEHGMPPVHPRCRCTVLPVI
jgi:hypothetical protein